MTFILIFFALGLDFILKSKVQFLLTLFHDSLVIWYTERSFTFRGQWYISRYEWAYNVIATFCQKVIRKMCGRFWSRKKWLN
jgi:hypothetical protein